MKSSELTRSRFGSLPRRLLCIPRTTTRTNRFLLRDPTRMDLRLPQGHFSPSLGAAGTSPQAQGPVLALKLLCGCVQSLFISRWHNRPDRRALGSSPAAARFRASAAPPRSLHG